MHGIKNLHMLTQLWLRLGVWGICCWLLVCTTVPTYRPSMYRGQVPAQTSPDYTPAHRLFLNQTTYFFDLPEGRGYSTWLLFWHRDNVPIRLGATYPWSMLYFTYSNFSVSSQYVHTFATRLLDSSIYCMLQTWFLKAEMIDEHGYSSTYASTLCLGYLSYSTPGYIAQYGTYRVALSLCQCHVNMNKLLYIYIYMLYIYNTLQCGALHHQRAVEYLLTRRAICLLCYLQCLLPLFKLFG